MSVSIFLLGIVYCKDVPNFAETKLMIDDNDDRDNDSDDDDDSENEDDDDNKDSENVDNDDDHVITFLPNLIQ